MRIIIASLVVVAGILLIPVSGQADVLAAATIDAPASVAGGTMVTITGTSPSGENGTTITVEDDDGKIAITEDWDGNDFTITFWAPSIDPENPANELYVMVNPKSPHLKTSVTIGINPPKSIVTNGVAAISNR